MTAAAVQCRDLQTSLSAARRELDAAETALLETDARVTRELVAAGKQAAECEALQVRSGKKATRAPPSKQKLPASVLNSLKRGTSINRPLPTLRG